MDADPVIALETAGDDKTLGNAKFVTMRLTLFGNLERDLPMQRLHTALRDTDHWNSLCKPFRSFHKDIVIPYAAESSLPFIVQCEPFEDNRADDSVSSASKAGRQPPHCVTIEFPPEIVMEWEGEDIWHRFCSDDDVLRIPAQFVDCVTFFESGVIAYSLALMFGKPDSDIALNAQQLLGIGALLNSVGQLKRGEVHFVLASDIRKKRKLEQFVDDRFRALAKGEDIFGAGVPDRTLFTFLARWIQSLEDQVSHPKESEYSVIELTDQLNWATELKGAIFKSFRFHALNQNNERNFDRMKTSSPAVSSIGIEVVGAEYHTKVLDFAAKANNREAPVDEFSLRLAGLVQNVFDFRRQDVEEVNDSLASAMRIGTDITFAQSGMAIRFVEDSRAFTDMRGVLGGSPYWLLVHLVLGHNEHILSRINTELEDFHRTHGFEGMIRKLVVYPVVAEGRINDAVQRIHERCRRRIRLLYYIPNIFRYPTEQQIYMLIARVRGLEAQRDYLITLDATIEQTLESSAREVISIDSRRFDIRLQLVLGIIGTLQIVGTLASLIAIWPTGGILECLRLGHCNYAQNGSQVLLILAAIAISVALLLGLIVASWLLRHRNRDLTSTALSPHGLGDRAISGSL
jgi:hypothetical protein